MAYLLTNNFEQVAGSLTFEESRDIIAAAAGLSPGAIVPQQSGLRFPAILSWLRRTRQIADSYTAWEQHRAAWASNANTWLATGVTDAVRRAALVRGECLYTPNDAARDANFRAFLWVNPTNQKSGWRTAGQLFWSGNGNPSLTRPAGGGAGNVSNGNLTTFAQQCAAAINADYPVGYRVLRINQWPIFPKATLSGGEQVTYLRDGFKTGSWPNLYQDEWLTAVHALWIPWLTAFKAAGGVLDMVSLDAEYRDARYWQQNEAYYRNKLTPGGVAAGIRYTCTWGSETFFVDAPDTNALTLCNLIAAAWNTLSPTTHPNMAACTAVGVPGTGGTNPTHVLITHDQMALGYGIRTQLTVSASSPGTFSKSVDAGSNFPHPNYPQGINWHVAIKNDPRLTDAFIASEYLPTRAEMNIIEQWPTSEDERTYRFDEQRNVYLRNKFAEAIYEPLLDAFPDCEVNDYEDTLKCGDVVPSSAGSPFASIVGCGRAGGTHQSRNFYSGTNISSNTKSYVHIPGTGIVQINRVSDVRGTVASPATGQAFRGTLDGYTVSHTVTAGQTAAQVATAFVNAWNAVTSGQNALVAGCTASVVSSTQVKLTQDNGKHAVEEVVFSVTGAGSGTFTKSIAQHGWYPRFLDDMWRLQGMISASTMPIMPWLLPRTDPLFSYYGPEQMRVLYLACMMASGGYSAYWNGNNQASGANPTPGVGDDLFDAALTEAAAWCEGCVAVPLPMPIRTAYDLNTSYKQDYWLNGRIMRLTVFNDATYRVRYQPKITPVGNKSVSGGVPLTFTVVATDADPGETLTYSLSGAPSGASIHPTTGDFSWTPSSPQENQTHMFDIVVTDDGPEPLANRETIQVQVAETTNDPPEIEAIPPQNASEHTLFTYQVVATDETVMFYSLSGHPAGMVINGGTGLIVWTPNETHGGNTYNFTVNVRENNFREEGDPPWLSSSTPMSVTVAETNTTPTITPIGPKSGSEHTLISFTASATDIDSPSQTLTWSLQGNPPSGASITSGGAFTWTPNENQHGQHTITFRVTDNGTNPSNLYAEEAVVFSIAETNTAPILSAIGNKSVDEGALLTFTASATDADVPTQALTYTLDSGAPSGATIHPTSGVFSWTPGFTAAGSYPVTIRVTDNGTPALDDSETITITVANVNQAPTLDPIGNKNAAEDVLLTFTATASDPDPGQTLTFTLTGSPPSGASITTGGVFTWTPGVPQGGSAYNITVRVTDNGSPAAYDEETISVSVSSTNHAPVLAAIGNKSVNELATLSFTANATDIDPGQSVTYSLDAGAPSGASIHSTSGAFSWTPTEAQGPGVYAITIRATDNGSPPFSDSETISVTVNEVNVAPVLGSIGDKSADEGSLLTFTATATDDDLPANTLTFSLVGAPTGATIGSASGIFSWMPAFGQAGDHTFTVKVTDNGVPPLSDEEEITVTVSAADNVPPVLSPLTGSYQVIPGALLTFTASATDANPGQTLTFSIEPAPDGATIDATTGAFSWSPEANQGGTAYTFDVIVTDNGSPPLSDRQSISVAVAELGLNLPVVPDQNVREGELLTVQIPGGSGAIYAFSLEPPEGMTLDAATGVLSWVPSFSQSGTIHPVGVIVSRAGVPGLVEFFVIVHRNFQRRAGKQTRAYMQFLERGGSRG